VEAALQVDEAMLPETLPWYGRGALGEAGRGWRVVYAVGGHPVVASRSVGQGLLVLVADSFLFSNEGLRESPQSEFISWALGPVKRVLFDETHFGIQQRRGVMALARQYRLHGFFAALGVLALLVIWQRVVPGGLAAVPASAGPAAVSGRAAHSGLEDLLRQHTPPERVLEHCLQAWARSAPGSGGVSPARRARLEERLRLYAATPARRRQVAACYRDLCEICAQKETRPWT
jgi:hypothetical protein